MVSDAGPMLRVSPKKRYVADGSFRTSRDRSSPTWPDENRPIDGDGPRSRRKKFGGISLENQQRNFLTGLVTENAVTNARFASNFIMLHDQETIEWK
jgi:hypothetical protein